MPGRPVRSLGERTTTASWTAEPASTADKRDLGSERPLWPTCDVSASRHRTAVGPKWRRRMVMAHTHLDRCHVLSSIDPLTNAPDAPSADAWIDSAFREHSAAIYAMALRSTRDPEAAADVTQEVFIRLFTEARAGRYPDNVRAWL